MRHTCPTRRRRRGPIVAALALLLASCTSVPAEQREESDPAGPPPLRAFTADSWWNTPVPADAPNHPDESAILHYMRTAREAGDGCLRLAGASNDWGQPVYWADAEDPSYDVQADMAEPPPELTSLRVPKGAESAPTSDAAVTVFDVGKGYVTALTGAVFDSQADTWTARGATVTYLDSDGLHAGIGRSDEPRNTGNHRGNNGATMMARWDEVAAGAIEHVLKVASGPEASQRSVFPMIGSDGESAEPTAPAQGLRFRIKPNVDLDSFDLPPQGQVIAEALQTYGFYIGDSAGITALKLENTRASRGEEFWELSPTALCSLPLSSEYWTVLPEGYVPGVGD